MQWGENTQIQSYSQVPLQKNDTNNLLFSQVPHPLINEKFNCQLGNQYYNCYEKSKQTSVRKIL